MLYCMTFDTANFHAGFNSPYLPTGGAQSKSFAAFAGSVGQGSMRRKPLAATIRTDRVGKGGAPLPLIPLSSCLDMVRKTLGQHDIPILQTIVMTMPPEWSS
jgi:hypothetical protein